MKTEFGIFSSPRAFIEGKRFLHIFRIFLNVFHIFLHISHILLHISFIFLHVFDISEFLQVPEPRVKLGIFSAYIEGKRSEIFLSPRDHI